MRQELIYMPILRVRQQEILVIKSFDFKNRIYPCLEIIKEVDRLPPKRKNTSAISKHIPVQKTFDNVYIPLISKINAKHVFIDIPVHLDTKRNMKPETLEFLRRVASNLELRTEYLIKLASLSDKVIPIVSTFFEKTGMHNSIIIQEHSLREHFNTIAFRTFPRSFNRDIEQIKRIAQEHDYLIVDWGNDDIELSDPDNEDILSALSQLKCKVIIHRNSISEHQTNVELEHEKHVSKINNDLIDNFKIYGGSCFSDYAGIKKDTIGKGGSISPGFIYFDAVTNRFYGFKGNRKDLIEFECTIVPAILNSEATKRMLTHQFDFLGKANLGWEIIDRINLKKESGKSAAKFKNIALHHYLHCIRTKIEMGDFD